MTSQNRRLTMKDNQAKYPQLRFKGFTDPWEQRKLGTIYNFGKGKGLPLDSFIYSSNNPAIAYGHLYTKYSEVISEVFWSSNDNGVLSKDNDLLFPGSSTVPNGTAQANAITLNNVKLGGDIIIGRPKEGVGVLSTFMSYQINSQRQKLFPITVGTTITHMYGKDISKLNFFITDYSEQEKIASFFKQLDDTIALHQRKLAKLKELKQGYLQKLFPKNGSKFPQLRFAGFADDWEERKLVSMTNYKNGKGHEDKQSTIGKFELINLNSISISGGLKHSGKFIDEADDTLQKDDLVMILSDVGHGDLLGRVTLIPEDDRFVLNQRVALLRPNATADPQFLFSYINAHQYYFKAQGAGMSQLNISKGSVENFISFVPIIEEQKKIGTFFKQLDDTITLHQRKLEKLQELKKGYLQKMFC